MFRKVVAGCWSPDICVFIRTGCHCTTHTSPFALLTGQFQLKRRNIKPKNLLNYLFEESRRKSSMKTALLTLLGIVITTAAQVQGFDISNWQADVDFDAAYKAGLRFVMIKATEGADFIDKRFSDHYVAATEAGFIRGGYHIAHPDLSASDQVDFFLKHGGGWSNGGRAGRGGRGRGGGAGRPAGGGGPRAPGGGGAR